MIWGDDIDGETGDHVVPFKSRSEQLKRKERSEESKPAEQKITGTKNDLHDSYPGSSSGYIVGEGSWFDLSLSNAREAGPDSSAAELSKCLAEPSRYNSKREKTSELGKGHDVFHSTDESKEQGDFKE